MRSEDRSDSVLQHCSLTFTIGVEFKDAEDLHGFQMVASSPHRENPARLMRFANCGHE